MQSLSLFAPDERTLSVSCEGIQQYLQSIGKQCIALPTSCPELQRDPSCIPTIQVDGNIHVDANNVGSTNPFIADISGNSIYISVTTGVGEEGSVSLLLSTLTLLLPWRLSDGSVAGLNTSGLLGVHSRSPVTVRNEVFQNGNNVFQNVTVTISEHSPELGISTPEALKDAFVLESSNKKRVYLVLLDNTTGTGENSPFPAVFDIGRFTDTVQIPLSGLHVPLNASVDHSTAGDYIAYAEVLEDKDTRGEPCNGFVKFL